MSQSDASPYMVYQIVTKAVTSEEIVNFPDRIPHSGDVLLSTIAGLLGKDKKDVSIWDECDFEFSMNANTEDGADALRLKMMIQAHMFVALLRWRVFVEAERTGVGDPVVNLRAGTQFQYMYLRLVDRVNVLNNPAHKIGRWIN